MMSAPSHMASRRRRFLRFVLALCMFALGLGGCAHVKPYERQYLADRIMDPAASRWEAMGERKMLSTREGAAGGVQGNGGGCACN